MRSYRPVAEVTFKADYLIDLSFQGVNKLFALLFKDYVVGIDYRRYFLPTLEIRDYNIMIDGTNFFNQLLKSDLRTYENIRKVTTCQRDDYTTGFALNYLYFKDYYEMVAIDLEHTLSHPLKMLKKAFCFTEKTFFVLEIFMFLS